MITAKVIPIKSEFISNAKAQEYLGVNATFFKRLRMNAQIHYYRVGRTVFYKVKDINDLIEKNKIL